MIKKYTLEFDEERPLVLDHLVVSKLLDAATTVNELGFQEYVRFTQGCPMYGEKVSFNHIEGKVITDIVRGRYSTDRKYCNFFDFYTKEGIFTYDLGDSHFERFSNGSRLNFSNTSKPDKEVFKCEKSNKTNLNWMGRSRNIEITLTIDFWGGLLNISSVFYPEPDLSSSNNIWHEQRNSSFLFRKHFTKR